PGLFSGSSVESSQRKILLSASRIVNSKYFPLGLPRSVRSGSILYSGPIVYLPSPSVPGCSVYASAALAPWASRPMRLMVPKQQAQPERIRLFNMEVLLKHPAAVATSAKSKMKDKRNRKLRCKFTLQL